MRGANEVDHELGSSLRGRSDGERVGPERGLCVDRPGTLVGDVNVVALGLRGTWLVLEECAHASQMKGGLRRIEVIPRSDYLETPARQVLGSAGGRSSCAKLRCHDANPPLEFTRYSAPRSAFSSQRR